MRLPLCSNIYLSFQFFPCLNKKKIMDFLSVSFCTGPSYFILMCSFSFIMSFSLSLSLNFCLSAFQFLSMSLSGSFCLYIVTIFVFLYLSLLLTVFLCLYLYLIPFVFRNENNIFLACLNTMAYLLNCLYLSLSPILYTFLNIYIRTLNINTYL